MFSWPQCAQTVVLAILTLFLRRTLSGKRARCECSRGRDVPGQSPGPGIDVLVQPEEVLGVDTALQFDQSVPVRTVRRPDPVAVVVPEIVEKVGMDFGRNEPPPSLLEGGLSGTRDESPRGCAIGAKAHGWHASRRVITR